MENLPLKGNRLYRPNFCILNTKNHIKKLKGHKSCPLQATGFTASHGTSLGPPYRVLQKDLVGFSRFCKRLVKNQDRIRPELKQP